jgi:hypothetical protein
MTSDPPAIRSIDSSITYRRPRRSEIGPRMSAPIGRATNPTANTANDASRAATGSWPGKKAAPIAAARKP